MPTASRSATCRSLSASALSSLLAISQVPSSAKVTPRRYSHPRVWLLSALQTSSNTHEKTSLTSRIMSSRCRRHFGSGRVRFRSGRLCSPERHRRARCGKACGFIFVGEYRASSCWYLCWYRQQSTTKVGSNSNGYASKQLSARGVAKRRSLPGVARRAKTGEIIVATRGGVSLTLSQRNGPSGKSVSLALLPRRPCKRWCRRAHLANSSQMLCRLNRCMSSRRTPILRCSYLPAGGLPWRYPAKRPVVSHDERSLQGSFRLQNGLKP
jgi:hypothetical protein